jgi:hypothetical protein
MHINRILNKPYGIYTRLEHYLYLVWMTIISLIYTSLVDFGILFRDILKDVVSLRLDMNKFYTMY